MLVKMFIVYSINDLILGIINKLKKSLGKKEPRKGRKADHVTHVPVKSDAQQSIDAVDGQDVSLGMTSNWSRASSQSIDARSRDSRKSDGNITDGTGHGCEDPDMDDADLKLDDLDISKGSTNDPKSTDCISLQQFLDETNQMSPNPGNHQNSSRLTNSYSMNETLNRTRDGSDGISVR